MLDNMHLWTDSLNGYIYNIQTNGFHIMQLLGSHFFLFDVWPFLRVVLAPLSFGENIFELFYATKLLRFVYESMRGLSFRG